MAGRRHRDQWLADQALEYRARLSRRRSNATSSLPRISAPASSGDDWLASVISISGCSPRRMRSTSGAQHLRQPHQLSSG